MNTVFGFPFVRRFSPRSWMMLFSLGGAQIVTILIGVGSSILWARHVEKETYGQYQLIISLMKIVSSFCLSGLGEALSISAAKKYDGNLSKIFQYKLGATILGSLVLLSISLQYLNEQPLIAKGLWVVVFFFPFYEMQKIWVPWMKGNGELTLAAMLDVIGVLLSLLILGILVWCGKNELNSLLTGLIGGSSLLAGWMAIRSFRSRRNSIKDTATIRYGFHATAATLLGGLVLSDRLIINHYLSAEKVAVYAIALLFPNQIKTLYSIFNQMLFPQLAEAKNIRGSWKYLGPKFPLLVGIFSAIGMAGFFLIPVVIPLLFSERYVEAVPYAKWLWLSLGVTAPFAYLGNSLTAQRKKKFTYVVFTGYPILLLGAFLFLIPLYGLWGAVLAQVALHFLLNGFYVAAFWYYFCHSS